MLRLRSLLRLSSFMAVLLSVGAASYSAVSAAGDLRVMPLGDSITFGYPNGGYRPHLYDLLTAASYGNIQFVGSETSCPGTLPSNAIHHEGHSGYMITSGTTSDGVSRGGLTDNIGTWLGAGGADPNVVLLMIGVNDIANDYECGTAPDRLSGLISMISNQTTGLKPNAQLIVAQIAPTAVDGINARIEAYNADVASVVSAHRALGENVSLVDMYSALNPSTDISADLIHPNQNGYDKIADVWFEGIQKAVYIPEPCTIGLLTSGASVLLALAWHKRRR